MHKFGQSGNKLPSLRSVFRFRSSLLASCGGRLRRTSHRYCKEGRCFLLFVKSENNFLPKVPCFLLCYNPISYNIFCKKQSITYRLLFCPSTILISLSVAAIIFYIASKSEIAAEIFSIMAGDSFDTFSTRQDLSTIPICGVSTTESFESPVSDFFRKILSYRQDQNQPTIFHHVSFFTASHIVRIEECAAASCSS